MYVTGRVHEKPVGSLWDAWLRSAYAEEELSSMCREAQNRSARAEKEPIYA
jgi:hypothetical protein